MQAMTKPDDGAAYRTKQNSGFGTWVWVFRRSEQSKQAQEYLIGDWISPFMEAAESNTSRRKLEVMSTVTEHSADIGAELSDTITVSGFPADHGQYAGNEEYEFAADRPYATVSVWWSGDPDNPSNDGAYKPSGGEVPTEDDNHRLLATWEIPAMNGTFKIGAGASNPRPSLPVTGGDVSLASVLAVSALAIGAILSIVVRWRRRYDRFKHWTMRWPIR